MVEEQDWIPVGALGEAFGPGANLLPQARGLAGQRVALHLESGGLIELQFNPSGGGVRITRALPGASAATTVSEAVPCSSTEIRPNLYFVDFIDPEQRAGSVSFILDLTRRVGTAVLGTLPDPGEARLPLLDRIEQGKELTGVVATFLRGALDGPCTEGTELHAPTTELVGHRIEYTYSPTERYEHVYLNDRFYTWHCLDGSERGLADTDRCHYLRLAAQLYLFVWREKLVPTLGVVIVDLEQLKTTGKILGYRDFDSGEITNFPVGARARVLSRA